MCDTGLWYVAADASAIAHSLPDGEGVSQREQRVAGRIVLDNIIHGRGGIHFGLMYRKPFFSIEMRVPIHCPASTELNWRPQCDSVRVRLVPKTKPLRIPLDFDESLAIAMKVKPPTKVAKPAKPKNVKTRRK